VIGLGYQPQDVRHIVLTHLDLDHVGGLRDFPHAEVHVYAEELDNATAQATTMDRGRFRPA
jgi:glyoxylase-like metal-dependent hydrolase (beta-lactamase superfamily II)